jgi:hypothetical protein
MRYIKGVLTLFFIVTLVLSCENKEKKELKKTLEYYVNGLIAYDKDLKGHFPFILEADEIKEMSFVLPSVVKSGGCSFALLRTQPTQRKFDSINKIYKLEYNPLNPSDSNIIILPDSINFTHISTPSFIPRFDKVLDDDKRQESNFWKQYTVYIIDSKPGNYTGIKQELLDKPYLPSDFEHGESRGVAINTYNTNIIYWLLLW